MMNRYLCIHGHFYQPPRENPWLEEIEYQESAYPFHDWNEQISVKCYQPNSEARILDASGQVIDVMNLYSKISFNFGPTLLSWMEKYDVGTYEKILDADRLSLKNYGGHGSAISQVYNHIIMPLADWRDKETEVLWGIADFQRRFKRYPESMWLAETAVDTESLEILSDHGMKYVILAPRQAKAFRPLGSDGPWSAISDESFDLQVPYLVKLPSGRSIAAFFYDGAISREVAFGGLLNNGEIFAKRLLSAFPQKQEEPRLLHIATDGETYGYHHPHGEMALAYAFHYLESQQAAQITNYGQFLEFHPPKTEIQIYERSSWSCVHGVERWRSDCGCATDPGNGWQQKWRKPLRDALDLIKAEINPLYETMIQPLVKDPRHARNSYIQVILDRSDGVYEKFLKEESSRELSQEERIQLFGLLEIQRHLLLMYTSCGWFFDEISGIEAVQNLRYAYRAIDMAKETMDFSVEDQFRSLLRLAPSNMPYLKTGEKVFDSYVVPAKVSFLKLAAHFAVGSVFENYECENDLYCFRATLSEFEKQRSGRATLAFGRGKIFSKITRKEWSMTFGVIHFGDHNINAGVAECPKQGSCDDKYATMTSSLKESFQRTDFPNVIRILDATFGDVHYSLKDLFKNEQRRVLDAILNNSLNQLHGQLIDIYQNSYPLARFLADLHLPLPKIFEHIAEFVQSREVEATLRVPDEHLDLTNVFKYLDDAQTLKIHFDETGISRSLETSLDSHLAKMSKEGASIPTLEAFSGLISLAQHLPFSFDLALIQSRFFSWNSTPQAENARSNEQLSSLVHKIGSQLKVQLHP